MPSLTYDEAVARAALIAVTSYTVDLDLTSGDDETAPTYRSYTVIRFTCRRPGEGTFADLHATEVISMRLNGRPLPPEAWTAGRLTLDDLAADNVLVVEAQMPWRRDGQGLHRAFDPADGAAYVFGHFFLDAAPSVTVCFDQPDLKAPWTVSVSTPRAWQVIGNGICSPMSRHCRPTSSPSAPGRMSRSGAATTAYPWRFTRGRPCEPSWSGTRAGCSR